jgi:Transposase
MEYAGVSRLDASPGGVAAGIDWASAGHAVCVVDAAGTVAGRFSVAHTAAGLRSLVQRLAKGWSARGGDRARRWAGGGCPAGSGGDGGGDHPAADQEPAVAVWVGGEQG